MQYQFQFQFQFQCWGSNAEIYKWPYFLQNSSRKWGRKTSSRPLFLKKTFIWRKSKWSINFDSPELGKQNKICKTLEYWSRYMLNFNFLEKAQWIISPPHFVHDFSKMMFVRVYSINWPSFIARLSLLLEILVYICITIVC